MENIQKYSKNGNYLEIEIKRDRDRDIERERVGNGNYNVTVPTQAGGKLFILWIIIKNKVSQFCYFVLQKNRIGKGVRYAFT